MKPSPIDISYPNGVVDPQITSAPEWTKVKPKVLLVTTCRWFTTARLAMAMKKAGFTVAAVCPVNHPIAAISSAEQVHTYNGAVPLTALKEAISLARPDIVLPCDDLATQQLHLLYRKARRDEGAHRWICELIERSLGAPECLPSLYARTTFMELAAAEGIRVPRTAVVASIDELHERIGQMGLPLVLKANGTSGGAGVRVVNSVKEAENAFRRLHAPPFLARVLKRVFVDRDYTLLWPLLQRQRAVVNAQVHIVGHEATSAIACWKGEVLASLHFEVLSKAEAEGHATVLRLIENSEMRAASAAVARRLNLSGVHGFDFMLEAGTGNAYLIEMNPRATQVGHLTLGQGRDIPAALHAALSGSVLQFAPKVTENDTIALFPQEWIRDPHSSFLQSGYHDVPWGEPELLHACIRARERNRKWSSHWTKQHVSPSPGSLVLSREKILNAAETGTP